MKNTERNARIREMLKAEGLLTPDKGAPNAEWTRFKRELNSSADGIPPQLEILPPRKSPVTRWLLPVAALAVVGMVFFLWQMQQGQPATPQVVKKDNAPDTAARTLGKGEVYRSGKREIRLIAGSANLKETAGKVRIAATNLTADFRLGERVDMQIEHPLIAVTITGTEFLFSATGKGGSIDLRHGSLAIEFKGKDSAERLQLKAPAKLLFTAKSHQIKNTDLLQRADGKPLYRYELVNGETFFAYQLQAGALEHKVQLLGGGTQTLTVRDIASVSLAERD